MKAREAKRCFEENLRLFADPKTEPEKFNLYKGLVLLAEAVAIIESKASDIQTKLRQ